MNRREFLCAGAGALAGATTGCLESVPVVGGSGMERADAAWANEREETGLASVSVTVDVALESGQYAVRPVEPEGDVQYEYELSLEDHRAVEVYLLHADQLDAFEAGEDVDHLQTFYGRGTSPAANGELDGGRYRLVVDNTDYGQVEPEGRVEGTLQARGSLF